MTKEQRELARYWAFGGGILAAAIPDGLSRIVRQCCIIGRVIACVPRLQRMAAPHHVIADDECEHQRGNAQQYALGLILRVENDDLSGDGDQGIQPLSPLKAQAVLG